MRAWAPVLLFSAACGPAAEPALDPEPTAGPRSAPVDLSAFAASAPLFPGEGAPIVPCGVGGVILEADALEVRTALCDPADVELPLPAFQGRTRLLGTLTHDALIADGGVGHVALTLDGAAIWEHEVPIPSAAAYVPIDVALPGDVGPHALLGLHVHNHGANAWRVHGLVLASP